MFDLPAALLVSSKCFLSFVVGRRRFPKWSHSRRAIVTLCACFIVVPSAAKSQYSPLIDLSQEDADVVIIGGSPSDQAARSMDVGDVNGDGLLDLVVGACQAAPLNGERQGELSIIWGPALAHGGAIDLAISQSTVSRVFGNVGDDQIFCGIACGDFNGDGSDDIIWGHPSAPPGSWAGKAYIILGGPEFPDTLDLATSPPGVFTIVGHAWSGWLGRGLCACDINGDGFDEVIVSAPAMEHSETYVIHGGKSFQASYDTAQDQPGMTRIVDADAYRGAGYFMACDDVDGDGYGDLLMGAPGLASFTLDGRATLLYGQSVLPSTVSLSDPSWRTINILPEYEDGQLGDDVAIGDVKGDGHPDLVVGSPSAVPFGCDICGEAYVIHDAAGLPDTVPVNSLNFPITRLLGNGLFTFGSALLVDDLTQDSHDEIVVGEDPLYPNRRAQVTVVYGHRLAADTVYQETDTTLTRIIAPTPDTDFGRSMASGDFNEDHIPDLVIGASRASPLGRVRAGAAYVLYGVRSPARPIVLEIDIRPGSCPNRLDLSVEPPDAIELKGGTLPVAVLGGQGIDITAVDVRTVRLEGASPLRHYLHDVAAPSSTTDPCACDNGAQRDARADLVLDFRRAEVAECLGQVSKGEAVQLTLTGRLTDGTLFSGTDCVLISGPLTEPSAQGAPGRAVLQRPVPNPFNPTTRIRYVLPHDDLVVLSIYDVGGHLVETLVDGVQSAGEHEVEWDAATMPNGVYFCRIGVGSFEETHKLVLLK